MSRSSVICDKGFRDTLTSSFLCLYIQTRCLLLHGTSKSGESKLSWITQEIQFFSSCQNEKGRQDHYNPIGLYALNLMLCSVFALLPYEHKPNKIKGSYQAVSSSGTLARCLFCFRKYQISSAFIVFSHNRDSILSVCVGLFPGLQR